MSGPAQEPYESPVLNTLWVLVSWPHEALKLGPVRLRFPVSALQPELGGMRNGTHEGRMSLLVWRDSFLPSSL